MFASKSGDGKKVVAFEDSSYEGNLLYMSLLN